MNILVLRYNSAEDHSNGLVLVNGKYNCFSLEDEFRTSKVYAETRIWDDTYEIKLRTEGGFHERYLEKFGPDFHKGMLWITGVPNFELVLIHIGNDDDDTAACLLVGDSNTGGNNFIGSSQDAYMDFYPQVAAALLAGERVFIKFVTVDGDGFDNIFNNFC